MASQYQALRVPISLLHQKVYSTSHRLESWKGIEPEKKEEKKESALRRFIESGNIFERIPYIRRFFVLEDEQDKVACRLCGKVAETAEARANHATCYKKIHETIESLIKKGRCSICDQALPTYAVMTREFTGVPVCSEDCMYVWERFSPASFEAEIGDS